MARWQVALGVLAVLCACAPAASAQAPIPAKPQVVSLDPDAPPDAPPHWLPGDPWVMQHWLPYDETRLYRLLGISRRDLWRWLRDDTKSLEGLVRERGWRPEELADALVRPWAGKLREPHRLAVLRERALKTITQGHLAQHVFFHSLHQNAIPDNAPKIFGAASREQFQLLRRSELSPVQICRLNGLSAAGAHRRAAATLRAYARRAVEGQAMPESQARRLLRRQLRQLPRWLHQTRYNGPPPLVSPRASAATASNYSNNAVLSADGRSVAWEGYEAAIALAKARGEINVLSRRLDETAAAELVSRPRYGALRDPRSSYNPSISEDGRFVAFESAPGNLNFAKRYGKMAVLVADVRDGSTVIASPSAAAGEEPRTSYSPSISADGERVVYESYATTKDGAGDPEIFVTDLPTGRTRAVRPGVRGVLGVSEPRISGDGRYVAFTATLAGSTATQVLLHDLRRGRTAVVSQGAGDAFEPELSHDGLTVAYTALVPGAKQSRVYVRDLRTGATSLVAPAPGDGLAGDASAAEPAISADGAHVAFTARNAGVAQTSVYVRDVGAGETVLASRADGPTGPPAAGSSGRPSISRDGRLVTFTSDAWNLNPAKCNSARGVFLRDLRAERTALLSAGDGANRYLGPTRGSSASGDTTVALICAGGRR